MSFFLGELAVAREHAEKAIALYDPQRDNNPQVSGFAQDLGAMSRANAALALWPLGYPDQALQRVQEMLTLAPELAHPYSLAYALGFAARVHQLRHEGQQTREQAEAAITLSTDHGFPLYLAVGTILRGWALAEQGQGKDGIAQICQGLAGLRATGATVFTPYYLALLAETYRRVGQAGEGLTVVGEALAIVDKNEERWWEAELYRLRGELLLTQEVKSQKSNGKSQKSKITDPRPLTPDLQGAAKACFQKAIDIARRQSAKSLELRAVTSLSRLFQKQGKRNEARQILAEMYGWFTEGFDTRDLKEAKTLLEELS
jgi:predicted ATPase